MFFYPNYVSSLTTFSACVSLSVKRFIMSHSLIMSPFSRVNLLSCGKTGPLVDPNYVSFLTNQCLCDLEISQETHVGNSGPLLDPNFVSLLTNSSACVFFSCEKSL